MIKPLYDARVGDLLVPPGAALVATCHRCGRASDVPRSVLEGQHPRDRVVDLENRLRCNECRYRGATVWVRWPDAPPTPH